ncbi:MAG: MOSC domain-containing protein [Bradyrhizobiaceae bacterium]|nr:MAG: MOSC domain-containing protein [Bradyrhizobiaceae bacterium]
MTKLLSVNVGLPRDAEWRGKIVRSGIWKASVDGRVFAGRLNLEGDGQADLAGHGGEQRAVMVYQIESYKHWQAVLNRSEFPYGQFGENLTVDGLADAEVCIGDRYRIASAVFEVSQPRVTCYKLGMRLDHPQMPALVVAHRRPGFYFRVIQEGEIGAGDTIEKISDGAEGMTVAEIDALLYTAHHPMEALRRASRIPALSPGWQGSIEALLQASENGAGGNPGLAPGPNPKLLWEGFKTLEVVAINQESEDVRSFELAPPDKSQLLEALPGQHLVVRINIGSDILTRNYSLIGGRAGRYRIAVKREPEGIASNYIHTQLKVGETLQTSAPRGTFLLADGSSPVVLISAGIGITPLLAMLNSLVSSKNRGVFWFHVARDRAHHPFADHVRRMLAGLVNGHSCVVYTRPDVDQRVGIDYDIGGRLDVDLLRKRGTPSDADFYLCGPPGFMANIRAGLQDWGIAPAHIHSEAFGSAVAFPSGSEAPPHRPSVEGKGPQVTFTRSGLTVGWDDSYGSLLELAEACSVPVRWSCRSGVCHNCESGLIEGAVCYNLEPLDEPNKGRVLICCAAPVSNISLEL